MKMRTQEEREAYAEAVFEEVREKRRAAKSSTSAMALQASPQRTAERTAADLEHLRSMGAQGGLSVSEAKVNAVMENLKKANEKKAWLHPGKPKSGKERTRAYRARRKSAAARSYDEYQADLETRQAEMKARLG